MAIYRIIFILLLSSTLAVASEKEYFDSENLQTYKNEHGKWVYIENSSQLNHFIRSHGTTLKAVKAINDTTSTGRYLFIPYSPEKTARLFEEEKRTKISTAKGHFTWPLDKPTIITSNFGIRKGRLHCGVDFSAVRGTPIYATMDGRVVAEGYFSGYGKSILIEHRNGFYTRYSHNSVNLVKKGDLVHRGQLIGHVGSTGRSTGNHLDFEIRMGRMPLNPLDFLPESDDLEIKHDYTHLLKKYRSPKQLKYYH